MAQKIQVLLVDDLDGSEAEGTVRFGLDGIARERIPQRLGMFGVQVDLILKAQGIKVKDRGRVPAELVARFKAATGQ